MSQAKMRSRTSVAVAMPLIILAIIIVVWPGGGRAHSATAMPMTFTVTNLDDSGPGSLRDAIAQANMSPGADIIDFQDELSGTITLTSGELLITDSLTINGPGIFSITVSGNHASRIFRIPSGVTVMISGLTMRDGNAPIANAGGIFNQGTLTLTNIVLSGNTALGGGGGLYSEGTFTVIDSTISDNLGGGGGGGIASIGTDTIIGSTISGNNGTSAGGGIFKAATTTLTIINSTISGNSTGSGGGGINIFNGTVKISFTTISGNSAPSGGGIFNSGTFFTKNSIVANNPTGGDCTSTFAPIIATGTNFNTIGICPGFTQVTPAQLNLGPLHDNGGPTQTHALLPGSVAIDAAPDCTDIAGNPVSTDQRGVGRPKGSACDVGAYEFVPCTVQPTITCPEDFSASTDPGQCSAVVDYTLPTADCPCSNDGSAALLRKGAAIKKPTSPKDASCSVSCTPPPRSTFPRGTSTVTCTVTDAFGNTAQCSFHITVNDTQPPQITCPANITVKSPQVGNGCAVVTYTTPTATDNCPLPPNPVTCTPPSGTCFPRGMTTVTCTATDSSGNTATCSFKVTVFDICVQDDSNPLIVVFVNIATGDYRFCCNGTVFTGKGKVTIRGNVYTLEHNAADRRVLVTDDESSHRGNASLQVPVGTTRCTISDRDTRNNTCLCQ